MDPEDILIILTIMVILILTIILIVFYMAARFFRVSSPSLQDLISRFPASECPEGESFSRQTIKVGNIVYRNCVKIVIAPSGLFFSVSIPFPWIPGGITLIPWEAVFNDGEERLYWKAATRLKIEGAGPVYITIPEDIARFFPVS